MARTVVWSADHESNDLSEWAENGGTGSSTSSGSISTQNTSAGIGSISGDHTVYATVNSGAGNKYARTQLNLEYGEGDYVSFGCWFYLPSGFFAAMQGEVQILRWDSFPVEDRGGLAISHTDNKLRVRYNTGSGGSTTGFLDGLDDGFEIPEGEWFHVRMDYLLSETGAFTELFIDDVSVGSSTDQNYFGETVTRIRAGIVAINGAAQTNQLEVFFDDADVAEITEDEPPTATTGNATSVGTDSAIIHGTVNPNGVQTSYRFQYGTTTGYGSQTALADAGSGTSPVNVQAGLVDLEPNTTYHYRLIASSDGGTDEGDDETFTTDAEPPEAVTGEASEITHNSAKLSGTVDPNGVTTTYTIEYGTTTDYSDSVNGSAGSGPSPVAVSTTISNLEPETEYHYRVSASSSAGTDNGDDETFSTLAEPVAPDHPTPTVPPTPRQRLTVETPSGRGYDLTDQAEGLRWSNVNPGGDEVCTFTLAREWFAANPELERLSVVRVTCGVDVLWQGRLEEFDPTLDAAERIGLTAYGMGARLKDGDFQQVFVDRSADAWSPPTLNQRLALADNDNFAEGYWTASADEQSLGFEGTQDQAVPNKALAMLMYEMPEGLEAAEFQYKAREHNGGSLEDEALYYSNDDSTRYQTWSSEALTADNTLRSAQPDTPARYLALDISGDGTINPSVPPKRTYVLFAVYGNHGLERRNNGSEPDGFLVSQMVGYIVADAEGVEARRVDQTSFIVEHATFPDPVAHEDAIAELDAYEGADWGTWGPDSVLDRSDTGYFEYKLRDRNTQHWIARRADFEELDLHSETATLYDRVKVTFTDETGTARVIERETTVADLGDNHRTAQIDGGTLTQRLAQQLGDAFLRQQGGFAPARGGGTLTGRITHHQRGPLPAFYLRADGSNMRIPDVLPSTTLVALSDEPDRRSTFPIKRVEVDASEAPIKTTVELDQSADTMSILQARLELASGHLPAQPRRRRRRVRDVRFKGGAR